MSANSFDSDKSIKLSKKKDQGDLPVIIVAVAATAFVVILVVLFLVIFPNRKIAPVLAKRLEVLQQVHRYQSVLAEHLPKFRDEFEQITQDSERVEGMGARSPDELKEGLLKAFRKNQYAIEAYRVGNPNNGDDAWWLAYPIEFTIQGPRQNLLATIKQWGNDIPKTVRLREVDIKRTETAGTITGVFALKANFVISGKQLKFERMKLYERLYMPEPSIFESQRIHSLREQIKQEEAAINNLAGKIGPVSHLEEMKRRYLAVQSRRADYAAQHEREFDLLETELRHILNRLEEKEVHRIIIKVEDTLIKDPRADQENQQGK